jgi:hypothetical protein
MGAHGMKIYFLTLALDAMPWITHHLTQFNKSGLDFEWHIVEGVAEPVKDTGWCKPISPRHSTDGTHEYLREISRHHPRVKWHRRISWPGKTAMLNHALAEIHEPGLVMQIDSDELWTADQLVKIHNFFDASHSFMWAQFYCDYQLGPNIRITTTDTYGNNGYEWFRCWRWQPGQKFLSHEPPVMEGINHNSAPGFTRDFTKRLNLVFQHPAYALEKQVVFKEQYYGYAGAVDQWRALQANTKWPCRVGDFLKWVKDDAIADLICKP